jgi:hypothetical protein
MSCTSLGGMLGAYRRARILWKRWAGLVVGNDDQGGDIQLKTITKMGEGG